ncbi:MAG: hypothetical protein B6D59_02515 [Campylobacteraceae bacterium 4484_4]|nr:MAG: hypothetical protein B6D59_02515 [Campylobacteraceae bacterium 4484_4]
MRVTEREFYKRGLADRLWDNRWIILLTILIFFLLSLFYLARTPKIYTSYGVIEITPKQNAVQPSALISPVIHSRYIDTQVEFLHSRFIVEKVIEALGENIEFYRKDSGGKLHPIDNSPFIIRDVVVKDPSFYNIPFELYEVDENHYALKLLSSQKQAELVYPYDKLIQSRYLQMRVSRSDTDAAKVIFKLRDIQELIDNRLRFLQISRPNSNSSMIEISYSAHSPKEAQRFVNALMEFYLRLNNRVNYDEYRRITTLLDRKIEEERQKLKKISVELENFTRKNRIAGIEKQTDSTIALLYENRKRLEMLRERERKAEKLYRTFHRTYDYKKVLSEIESLNDPGLKAILKKLSDLQTRYNTLRLKYKPEHPQMQKIKKLIRKALHHLDTNLFSVKSELSEQVEATEKAISDIQKQLSDIPAKELHYSQLQKEYSTIEKSYFELLQKRKELSISESVQQGLYRYRIIDYAYLPKHPSKPKKSITLLLGLFLGLFFGIFLALIKEYFGRKIRIPSEVTELTKLPYLGTIPYIKDPEQYSTLYLLKSPHSIASQMIWSLRTTLEFFLPKKRSKIIAVSSMVSGEGKTTVTANLAASLGMGEKKSIAVSFDLRASELHTKFGLPNKEGIADVLFGKKTLYDVTYVSRKIPNLHVIPSGKTDVNPVQMINSDKIGKILKELKNTYDYILIDLPPVTIASEALYLMKKADFSIVVLKAGYSRKDYIIDMEKIVAKYKIDHIGFVLNSVNKRYIRVFNRQENRKYMQMKKSLETNYTVGENEP